ncbi:fibronectin type III domain-containing protein [Geodermatophilus telluris]|uniref:fibronectin type III domain-containing protein n=1 Tax=Geodermatophilus telluris TaxID=1190417 RepID=UPI001113C9F1|nr:fibronectin type III domain-containing protein [Geodermatophilus telluris]
MALAAVVLLCGVLPAGGPAPRAGDSALQPASFADPAPPTNVVTASADRALRISWTASTEANVSSYDVSVHDTVTNSDTVTNVAGTATSTTVSGLLNGRSYVVTLRTRTALLFSTGVGSTTSTPVTGVPRDSVPPAAPSGVVATAGERQVRVTWTPNNTDTDADGYRVLRDGVPATDLLPGGATASWTDTGLVPDRTYGYTVQTHDTSGNWSASSVPVASARPFDHTPPATPTGLTAAAGDGRVVLSWTANSEPDLAAYVVLRNGAELARVTGTSWTDTGVVNDTTYAYQLAAADAYGNVSPVSAPAVSARPTDLTAPATPAGLRAVAGDGRVVLSWTANSEPDLAAYVVLRNGVEVARVTGTSWTDTGVVNDTTYPYRLAAVDGHGNTSAASDPAVTARPTDQTAPATPRGLTAVAGDGRVVLSWTANSEPDLDRYVVYRDGAEVVRLTGTSWVDTGVTNDTTYAYRLAAVDTHANVSPTSDPAVTARPTDQTAPATPTGFVATAGDGSVQLRWAPNTETDVDRYVVHRDGVEVARVAGTSWTDTGVVNDTGYAYRIQAVDGHGNASPLSDPAVTARPTDLTAPATPTGLTAVARDGSVELRWDPGTAPDVDRYVLHRDGAEVARVTGTSWTDTGVVNGTTYAYRVQAVDGHGNASALSDPAVTARPTDQTPPATPTGLVAVARDGSVELRWTANTEPDLDRYVVYRDGAEVVRLTGTSWVDTGVPNDTTYAYRLAAVDTHANVSPTSDPAVTARPTDQTAPSTPTGLVATARDGSVELRWGANPEPDVDHYTVYRDGVEVARQPGTSRVDTGLVNDTTYAYRLQAVDGHGNASALSDPAVTARPTDQTAPAVPTGLVATARDGSVELRWDPSPEPDVDHYVVYRDGVEVARPAVADWVDTVVVNDATYAYRVQAVDGHGNASAASDLPVTARPTDLTPPATPTGLVATAGDGSVELRWDAAAEPDVDRYVVHRDGVEVARVAATGWTDTGLVNGTTYAYRVQAVDGHGNASPPSDPPVTARPTDRTAPAAPTGVAATAGDGRAVLRWVAGPEPDVATHRVLGEDGGTLATAAAPATQVTVPGLVNGTERRLRVVAVDASGNVGLPSAEVAVTPQAARVPAEGSGHSGGVAASADGRFVVVGTSARWEAADTNTAYELYLLDRGAGTARRIAPLPATATGSGDPTNAAAPAVSDDGRYVALATTAALRPEDTNRLADVYRLDTRSGTWALVSVPAGGTVHPSVAGTALQTGAAVYATSPTVVLSGDGDLVLFYSARPDLVPGDTNGVVDVFAKSVSTGAVTRVSTSATGGDLPRAATGPALAVTPDGRFALFPAASSSGPVVLYRKTLSGPGAGQALVVSAVPAGGRSVEYGVYRDAGDVALSDDGRFVALVTAAKVTTPTPTAAWATGLAYRVDTVTGAVAALGNGQTSVWEHQVELDPTGRHAFFATTAAEVAGDGNGHTDHLRRDLGSGSLTLVTADAAGRATAGPTGSVTSAEYGRLLATDGDRVLVTTSQALTPGDTNRLRDLYAKDLADGSVTVPRG